MDWIELSVFTTDVGLDAVSARLAELGLAEQVICQGRESVAAFLNNAALYWDYADIDTIAVKDPCVQVYLEQNAGAEEKIREVRDSIRQLAEMETGLDLGSLRVSSRPVKDEDWANNWKAYYKPMCIGKRLLVSPSWEQAENPEGRVELKLDPGMAFGSGSHQTTRMCLELLEERVSAGDEVLDLGSGSGILAIASVLLGAKSAIGVDIDPVAEKIARENAALNGLDEKRLTFLTGNVLEDAALVSSLSALRRPVVIANIVANVIIALAPLVPQLITENGVFITSGLINERVEEVKDALIRQGLRVLTQKQDGEWNALLLARA